MGHQKDRNLLLSLFPLALLLAAVSILSMLAAGLGGPAILVLVCTVVVTLGIASGLFYFIKRYPAIHFESSSYTLTTIYVVIGLMISIEGYYIVVRYVFGLPGTIEKFGSLGDSLNPLTGLLSLLALIISLFTSRTQSIELKNQQAEIEKQTSAWQRQADYQKQQADEFSRNNELYRHMILSQKMANWTQLQSRMSDLRVEKERLRQELNITQNMSFLHPKHPMLERIDDEIRKLQVLAALEFEMLKPFLTDLGPTQESIDQILKKWKEWKPT